jgi:peroxiredoxin
MIKFLIVSIIIFVAVPQLTEANKGGRTKTGDRFPDFSVINISKVPFDKNELKNKIVVYDVGASWTKGSSEIMEYYGKLLRTYRSKGLRVVSINVDDDKNIAIEYIRKHSPEFPVIYDQEKKLAKTLNPSGFPMAYILNRNGLIKTIIKDYCDKEFELLEKEIIKSLREK